MDQHGLAVCEVSGVADPIGFVAQQVRPHGARYLRQRGCLEQVDAGRKRHHLTSRHQHLRRVTTAGEQGANLFTDRTIHALTHGRNPAAAFQPDDRRRSGRRRVMALALHEICAVDRSGHDIQQDFIRPGAGGSSTSAT